MKIKSTGEHFDIKKIAKLANLQLSEEELTKYTLQLTSVLNYFEILRRLDTSKVEPTSQVTGLENVLREDKSAPSLSQEEVLKNAKSKHNGFFKVKAILEAL